MLSLFRKKASATEVAIHQRENAPAQQHNGIERQFVAAILAPEGAPTPPIILPPSIGPANQGVMFCTTRAKRVAVMLARRGFAVKKIVITPSLATITLKSTPGCRDLGGEQICHALCCGKDERTYAVLIDGISVEWTVSRSLEKGGAA